MGNSHSYGGLFKAGDIVWTHPATDAFMQGDVSGIVSSVGRKWVSVRMTRSGKIRKFTADLLAYDSI